MCAANSSTAFAGLHKETHVLPPHAGPDLHASISGIRDAHPVSRRLLLSRPGVRFSRRHSLGNSCLRRSATGREVACSTAGEVTAFSQLT
jgi:hypothetical protein